MISHANIVAAMTACDYLLKGFGTSEDIDLPY